MTAQPSVDAEQLALAGRLRAARLDAGLTQRQVADAVRIGRTAVADIERARRGVEVFEGVRLARALGMSLGELVDSPAVAPEVLDLVNGLPPEQVEQVLTFADFLLWRRRGTDGCHRT